MTSRLIHALAFRPSYFTRHPSSRWGALYHRREISRGTNKPRVLYIPNKPLRSIQRALLFLFLNRASHELGQSVFGARPGQRCPLINNAKRHLGQMYIVSFDLADFFPSITLGHIVSALAHIRTPLGHCALQDNEANLDRPRRDFPWTHDAAVLVARLCTYRGRLPQGASTSPLLANIAFSRFDDLIAERLGTGLVYSRYFDDITISVSKSAARRLHLNNAKALADYAQTCIETELIPAGFRLNAKKTRFGTAAAGFTVTGLRINKNTIDIPRKTRRQIRALLHTISTSGLLAAARKTWGAELEARIRWDSARQSHHSAGRRLPQEKLCALMLKRLLPDLVIRVFDRDETEAPRTTEITGRQATRVLEKLLTYAWTHRVSFRVHDDYVAVKAAGEREIARLFSKVSIEFFGLAPNELIRCTELFHKLAGWSAFLEDAENHGEARRVADLGRELRRVLAGVQAGTRSETTAYETGALRVDPAGLPLTAEQENRQLAREVFELIRQFMLFVSPGPISHDLPELERNFKAVANSEETFSRWLETTMRLYQIRAEVVPPESARREFRGHDIHETIRLLSDRLAGRRAPTYEIERDFYKKVSKDDVPDSPRAYLRHQFRVLGRLKSAFDCSLALRNQRGPTAWIQTLNENTWSRSIAARLHTAVQVLRERLVEMASQPGVMRVFQNAVLADLNAGMSELMTTVSSTTSELRWKSLFATGSVLSKLILEQVEASRLETETTEKRSHTEIAIASLTAGTGESHADLLRLIHLLRCRDAHPATDEQMNDWIKLQRLCGSRLRRVTTNIRMPDNAGAMFGNGHLELTELEANDLKLSIIEGVDRFLRQVSVV
ncbi:MAG: RNA-directed DNA polymerase [Phycisphaerales bacterium]|nr:RNA-directed DNA polymerase [Phycisphaerales bacterium]